MLGGICVRQLFSGFRVGISRTLSMATEKLNSIPAIEIDPEGTFKYILIKVYGPDTPKGSEPYKMIVRGFKWAAYHGNIYDATKAKLEQLGLDSECVGGGRIQHDPVNKSIKVYGHSTGFGKADHEVTVGILKNVYQGYNITWSDEGY
ncbi:14 kDa phosphohistidine phosphatase [Anabrus simplex]|uniref:14 kDa phosphohistidine phosphatase n=1 Tax=Anabrus simplex TaxID=316456 RepID=UPI0035A30248